MNKLKKNLVTGPAKWRIWHGQQSAQRRLPRAGERDLIDDDLSQDLLRRCERLATERGR